MNELKKYISLRNSVLNKINEFTKNVNDFCNENAITLAIDFPNHYSDYDIDFKLVTYGCNGDELIISFDYTDQYDDILDEYIALRIPQEMLYSAAADQIEFILSMNSEREKQDFLDGIASALSILRNAKYLCKKLGIKSMDSNSNKHLGPDITILSSLKKDIDEIIRIVSND